MKLNYKLILFALLTAFILYPGQKTFAQDTLTVEWLDGSGNFVKNALYLAIQDDANPPEGRVYKLRKGGYYWITETITTTAGSNLRIVGEKPTETESPAVLQIVARDDGTYTDKLITCNGSMTLKNLYIIGADDVGVQGSYYQPIQIDASDSRFVIDNCVFERSNFAIIAWTANNNDIFLTNNVYRNLSEVPPTQIWTGRGVSIWADQDTVIVENNTFFNVPFTAFQLETGIANYLRFNHNTLVDIGRGINTTPWLYEAYFANNLIINGFWEGEAHNQNELDASNRDPRATTSGLFGFGTLPGKYGPEEGRRILFAKNAAWIDPAFTDWHQANNMRSQPFVGPVLKEDFIDPYEQIVVTDTTWLDSRPDFPVYPTSEYIEDLKNYVTGIRDGDATIPAAFWRLPLNDDGTICNTCASWPLPEDFSYTQTSQTTGTNGLPLGDLNWFPDKKAEWEAIKEQDIADIEALAGAIIELEVVDEIEAEQGVVTAPAEIRDVAGFAYFQMDGGGWFQWDFDIPAEGEYQLNVWTHLRGNATRGQRIFVNGVSIHDPMGWGEYIWSPTEQTDNIWYGKIPADDWTWTLIKQDEILEEGALTLPAGPNTIRIESSWGYQNFAGIDVEQDGNVVVSLRPPSATYEVVNLIVEGAVWTPSGLQSVAMGTNGSVEATLNAPNDGIYRVQLIYQNYTPDVIADISIDNVPVISGMALATEEDSSGASTLSPDIDLTAGDHTIKVTTSDINLDVLKLVKVLITDIEDDPEIPDGYALGQNYPNPFNPSTKINFSLGRGSNIKLVIYNILGQEVVTLINNYMRAGIHIVEFNAASLSSGVYFYGIEAGDVRLYKKMMLLK